MANGISPARLPTHPLRKSERVSWGSVELLAPHPRRNWRLAILPGRQSRAPLLLRTQTRLESSVDLTRSDFRQTPSANSTNHLRAPTKARSHPGPPSPRSRLFRARPTLRNPRRGNSTNSPLRRPDLPPRPRKDGREARAMRPLDRRRRSQSTRIPQIPCIRLKAIHMQNMTRPGRAGSLVDS